MSKPHFQDPSLLTTFEVARALGVTLRTVQIWCESGKLKAGKTPGGHRRIAAGDVAELRSRIMGQSTVTVAQELVHALRTLMEAGERGRVTPEVIALVRSAIDRAECTGAVAA